jgi:anthranilate/para-aminobenzoate synthase component I
MTDTHETVTIDLDESELEPVAVYAKLRSYTPGRPSFLLESRDRAAATGRYSIVGYRVCSGEMMPPGVDAIAAQIDSYARLGASASFAEALARSAVGYFSYANTHSIHGIRGWEDETISGHFLTGATVVVFDHLERRISVAGRKKGRVAERCVWELRHGPEPAPFGSPASGTVPLGLRARLDEEQLAARIARAKRFLGGPVQELAVAQTLHAPTSRADAFDVYRALRAASAAPAGYFIDFGGSPMMPPMQLLGLGAEPHVVRRMGGEVDQAADALGGDLRNSFPHRAVVGSSPVDAARMIRRLEDTSRELVGAIVGYVGPAAQSCFALAHRVIVARADHFELGYTVPLGTDTDPAAAARSAHELVGPELAAIRMAQDAAPERGSD